MMSKKNIIDAINECEMCIFPFDVKNPDERLTPAGFNFSFTNFIISLNNKCPCALCEETIIDKEYKSQIYFMLEAGDTALALTRETIWVSGNIAGTFHSKVSYASQGLGQISTTLDPGWQGQLLISINNPNKSPVKVLVGNRKEDDGVIQYKTFITLCLYRLISPAETPSDNTYARLTIIEDILRDNVNRGDVQKTLDEISAIKSIVDKERQTKDVHLGLKTSNPQTLTRFNDIHNTILDKLDKIVLIGNSVKTEARTR
ncbi:MAG: hypothetical protein LBH62_04390 [Nitrososphaerota archaeon]|nr:hypothetical protein [Nitrososphaerota archaeon]